MQKQHHSEIEENKDDSRAKPIKNGKSNKTSYGNYPKAKHKSEDPSSFLPKHKPGSESKHKHT